MITFITHIRVSPENAAAFEALMTDVCARVRENEPGVVHYSFAKSVEDQNTYVVIEVYRDEAALRTHAEADYVKASVPKSSLLIEGGKYDIQQYVSPGAQPVRRPQQPEAPAAPRT
jgi:quinol monooxygenase YgiN